MAPDRSSEWIGASFVGIGLGAAGVAGALAWVTSAIGPAAIPIWLFAVGGAALILRGPLGSALADRIRGTAQDDVPQMPPELYAELDELRARLGEIEERVDFSERLLTKQNSTSLERA
jgi:hypothetical protein